jgi:hypothetical protein
MHVGRQTWLIHMDLASRFRRISHVCILCTVDLQMLSFRVYRTMRHPPLKNNYRTFVPVPQLQHKVKLVDKILSNASIDNTTTLELLHTDASENTQNPHPDITSLMLVSRLLYVAPLMVPMEQSCDE